MLVYACPWVCLLLSLRVWGWHDVDIDDYYYIWKPLNLEVQS